MRRIIIFSIAIFTGISAYSQDINSKRIDSVMQIMATDPDKAVDIDFYNELASQQIMSGILESGDSLHSFVQMTYDIAKKLNKRKELANTCYNLGRYKLRASNKYAEATPYFLESLLLFEEFNDSAGISKSYMQLGLISYIMQYFEDAIKNFNLSLAFHPSPTANYLMAISYSELNNFTESRDYFSIAIEHFKKNNYEFGVNECYMYIGKLFEQQDILDSAYYYLKMSIDNLKATGEQENLSRPYALISNYFLKTGDLDSAIYFSGRSFALAQNTNDNISPILSTKTLSVAHERKGDYKKAHEYLLLYNSLKNESIQGNTKQKIAEMQGKFDFEKKINDQKLEHQAELHRKDQIKNIMLASAILVLLFAGALWSRLSYVRRSKAALQKEKDISENLLLNILPYEVAEELKEKGYTDAKEFEQATILFTDFKGFTELSAKLSASDLVDEINYCFKAFDHILEKYKVEKIKTIGDAYMAAGGIPVPDTDSVRNTVFAALEMQEFIASRKQEQDVLNKPAFEMRVGIHSGPVVAGIVGVKKFQYDIWGDTVNTASRVENNGIAGKVNISHATYSILRENPSFSFESRGKINVKGKGDLDMYFVSKMA